jgi:hypothetical protein
MKEAQQELSRLVPGAPAVAPNHGRGIGTVLDRSVGPLGPANAAGEERLRRGRVAVRGEQLVNFERVLRATLHTLERARQTLTSLKVAAELASGLASRLLHATHGRELFNLQPRSLCHKSRRFTPRVFLAM